MQEMREALERLRPTLGARSDRLWAMYLASDREEQREIERTVRLLDLKRNRTAPGNGPPDLPPPEPGVLAGWLRLGEVRYPSVPDSPFGLERGELLQHVGIFGRSGAGKTNTVMALLRGLIEKDVPFLVFDWKRNYRDLLAAPWVPEGKVAAFTAGRDLAPIRLNPLRPPPGTEPRTWLKKLIEIMAHAYFLGEGVMYLLQEAIDTCYRQAGVYDGGERYPTFRDVHAALKRRKVTGREANWMASTLRTTAALTFGPMSDTVCASAETDIGDLLSRNVVLELDALTDTDKVFFVEAVMLFIHHMRLGESTRERLKHVLVVEEAHHVFLRSKQETTSGEPITDVILREIRELGEGVVLIDQHPSQIAFTALGNTFCTIAMNLKHRADVNTISDACLLDGSSKELLGRLPVGHAIVKLQDRWTSPFRIQVPLVPIVKGVITDSALVIKNPENKEQEQCKSGGSGEIPAAFGKDREIPAVPGRPKSDGQPLSPDALVLLKQAATIPEKPLTQRYLELGFSRRMGTGLKRVLVIGGFVREVSVPIPGGRVTLLEPTSRGWAAIGLNPPSGRQGGVKHRFWVTRLADEYRRSGFKVEFEVAVGEGRTIDLVASNSSSVAAVEVEASGRRMDESLKKLANADASVKLLACCDRRVMERARDLCARLGLSGIDVVHVWSPAATIKS